MNPDTTLPKTPKVQEYIALISQTSTNDPTGVVLRNTAGFTITWQYDATGRYWGVLSEELDPTKTTLMINSGSQQSIHYSVRFLTPGQIYINSGVNGTFTDNILTNAALEIKIYN